MTRVRPFTRLGPAGPLVRQPRTPRDRSNGSGAFSGRVAGLLRSESTTTQYSSSGAADRREERAGRRAGCRWEWRSHGANGCAGRARTMFILQPVPEHPRRAVPALAAWRPKPSALPRPIPRGPAPEPLVSVTSVTGWRPQVKDRDGGSRTLYSQIRDLMLYPMSYILAARDGTRTRDFRTLHPAFNRQTPRAIPDTSDRWYTVLQCRPRQARLKSSTRYQSSARRRGAGV